MRNPLYQSTFQLAKSQWGIVVFILLMTAGCENKQPGQPKASQKAKGKVAGQEAAVTMPGTARVEGRSYAETVMLPGASLHGLESTAVYAKLGGYISELGQVDGVDIDLGTHVKKDTILAVLDVPEMQDELSEKSAGVKQAESAVVQAEAAIAEAEAAKLQREAEKEQANARRQEKRAMLQLSEKKFVRLTSLAESGTIGQELLDESQFTVDAAQAALASIDADVTAAEKRIVAASAKIKKAEADKASAIAHVAFAEASLARVRTLMKYSTIRAPFAGVVTRRNVDHGAFVVPAERNSAAMPLFEVTRIDRVRIVVGVPNTKVSRVEPGMEAKFHDIGGLPGKLFVGKVTRSAGALDPNTRMMRIEVEFANPVQDQRTGEKVHLKPGMFGTLTVVRQKWSEENPIAVIPTSAVATDENGVTYAVVLSGEKGERRNVDVVFNDAHSIGISGGIKIGETVSTNGLDEYK